MELKPPLTFEEQIGRLKQHGMIIDSKDKALAILKRVNYYRFTGYALENRKSKHSSDYQIGTSFENVWQRYQFDVEMRHILRKAIENVEIYYRTQISYVFSIRKCGSPPHDQHYDRENYFRKDAFDSLVQNIKRETGYYWDSLIVNHHKLKYDNKMPLWVLVEVMTFSSLSKFYKCMYISDQEAISKTVGTSAAILGNNLHCLANLRNKCAHADRLYGKVFNPPVRLGRNFLQKHPEIKNDTLFGYIVMLIKRLPDKVHQKEAIDEILLVMEKYESEITLSEVGFPKSYRIILQNLI